MTATCVVWCSVVWCGVVWCGVVWCGVCVCVCVTCSRFLIARQKILYLSALRDGKEGRRVEAATHTQNLQLKL